MNKTKQKALVAYVFTADFGNNKAGEVIQLEPEKAQSLLEAGYLAEATEEDVGGGEPAEEPQEEVVSASVRSFQKSIEKSIADATENVIKRMRTNDQNVTVAAEVKQPLFKSFGDFATCVRKAANNHGESKKRLVNHQTKTANYLNETTDAEGGELVPVEYSNFVFDKMRSAGSLLDECTVLPCEHGNLKIPAVNETSRATGSRWGGVRAYWVAEGSAATISKPAFTNVTLEKKKLVVLVGASDELLQDNAYALDTWLGTVVPQELTFMTNDGIFNGAGTTEMTGIIGNTATVSVAKESGQTGSVFHIKNLYKMYARMFGPSLGNAKWYINQNTLPELFNLKFPDTSGTVPAYLPAGAVMNVAYAPHGTLFGKPIVITEVNASNGTVGDVIFADLSQYYIIHGGVDRAQSMHLKFDTHEQVFRFTLRIDGKPAWTSALTPYKGSETQSPYVTLATRT